MLGVGDGKNSKGSDWIIKVLEEKEDRPVMDICLGWRQYPCSSIK